MDKESIEYRIVKAGLAQIPSVGLERLINYDGVMCLDGQIVDDETGRC